MPSFVLSVAARLAQWLPLPVKKIFYRLGPLSRLIRGALNRAGPESLAEFTIPAGPLSGRRLLLNYRTDKSYWLGTYEPEVQAAIQAFVKPGAVAYDAGANIGYNTLHLALAAGANGKVFAFEPHPGNLERLRANLALNPDLNNIAVIPKAVTDSEAEVNFLIHSSNNMGKVGASLGRQDQKYVQEIQVQATSLDHFVFAQGHPQPDVIKIDIEGGEILAISAMQRILKERRPLLFIEFHGHESVQGAWTVLEETGYSLHRMQPGYPRITQTEALDWKAYLLARPPAVP
jgi:FkbM family methyltransferase